MSVLSDICLLMAMFFSVKTMIGDPFTAQKDLFKAQSFFLTGIFFWFLYEAGKYL